MKYAFIFTALAVLVMSSCGRDCEKVLDGQVVDMNTGEALENVQVIATGAEETGSIGRQFYTLDPVFTNENGMFSVSIEEDIYLWEYTLELEGYVGANLINKGFIENVSCGSRSVELAMQPIAYVDINVIEDQNLNGNRAIITTDFPSAENAFILGLGDTQRIPVIASESFEIRINIYNELDELQKGDTVTVDLVKGASQILEIGI